MDKNPEREVIYMKKAGERRVVMEFWRSDVSAYSLPSMRANGNYYATCVLMYNDYTYENVSVNLGKYYEFEIYGHCKELYGEYGRLLETRNYKEILGRISCVGLNREEALEKIKNNSKTWRNLIKNYKTRKFEVIETAKVKRKNWW